MSKSISLSEMVLSNGSDEGLPKRKPRWLRGQLPSGEEYRSLIQLMQKNNLHTVCEEAKCPNLGECWKAGVAVLMILGDTCTRSCGFCHIKTGRPPVYDEDEPRRVGDAVRVMDLNYVVITSVNRDELPDGGAQIWADTIREIRKQNPTTQIEVLIPDYCGDWDALQTVLDAEPDVLAHNLETVPRLYRMVRPQAKYDRSMELLRRAKAQGYTTKTGIMAGIGETDEEIEQLMTDLLQMTKTDQGSCEILTIGQYLQPTTNHLPVLRYVTPDQFEHYKTQGEAMGLIHVESGPMVRSSYHADQQAKAAKAK